MAAVKFDRRRQLQGETFDSFATDLKLLARGLDKTETNKLIRNAIACKSLDERVRQRCLEKSKNLTLEMAIDIGRMFEATKDGMQVMSGKDPKVEVNKLAWRDGSTKRSKTRGKQKTPKENNEQVQKCSRCGHNVHKPQDKCPAINESYKKCKKIGHFAQVSFFKTRKVNLLNEMHYPSEDYSSDEEGPDSEVQLLHVASLEMNSINNKQSLRENDEFSAQASSTRCPDQANKEDPGVIQPTPNQTKRLRHPSRQIQEQGVKCGLQCHREQPAALLPKIVAKFKEMEQEGHLAKVAQPTDWVNSMVVSTGGEKIRICLDPGDLNKAVKREHYPIPTVEEIAAKIPDAKVFPVLNAKSGYFQMKLDYESSLLTTMNTPIDRYK
ncbi:hypothetical protein ACROYT_G041452 [Oculina patagonica]